METVQNESGQKDGAVADKVAGFGREAASTMRGVAKRAEAAFTEMVDSDQAKTVIHAVEGGLSEAGNWLSGAQKKATATVRKYPVHAVVLGFGLGALIATLVRRPWND